MSIYWGCDFELKIFEGDVKSCIYILGIETIECHSYKLLIMLFWDVDFWVGAQTEVGALPNQIWCPLATIGS